MPEEMIVYHCSPTLAGVKTANLFTSVDEDESDLLKQIAVMNRRYETKGIRFMLLGYNRANHPLIYVFRMNDLKKDLADEKVLTILESCGYDTECVGKCLTHLIERLKSVQFPHEIGCFLGYPAEDVIGFINQDTCKYSGVWKVYGNVEQAKSMFEIYEAYTKDYMNRFMAGEPLENLIMEGR